GNATNVTLAQVYVAADASDPARDALYVGGTNGNDVILIQSGTVAGTVKVVVNGVPAGQFPLTSGGRTIGRILAWGNDGNDSITVHANVTLDAVLDGGD